MGELGMSGESSVHKAGRRTQVKLPGAEPDSWTQ